MRVACRQRHARGRLDQLHELEAGGVEGGVKLRGGRGGLEHHAQLAFA